MKPLYLFLLCSISSVVLSAQAPQAFKFQGVARDASDAVYASQAVHLRLLLLEEDGSPNPPVVYEEQHTVFTSPQGVFSVNIGEGTAIQGDFSVLDWANQQYSLQVKIDPNDSNNFIDLGKSRLLSVPYALHAETVSNSDDADADPTNEIQSLNLSGTNLSISGVASSIDLSSIGGGLDLPYFGQTSLNGAALHVQNNFASGRYGLAGTVGSVSLPNNNAGVIGMGSNAHGILGVSTNSFLSGVYGISQSASGTGVFGDNNAGGVGGFFRTTPNGRAALVTTTGRVGLGTETPLDKVEIADANKTRLSLNGENSGGISSLAFRQFEGIDSYRGWLWEADLSDLDRTKLSLFDYNFLIGNPDFENKQAAYELQTNSVGGGRCFTHRWTGKVQISGVDNDASTGASLALELDTEDADHSISLESSKDRNGNAQFSMSEVFIGDNGSGAYLNPLYTVTSDPGGLGGMHWLYGGVNVLLNSNISQPQLRLTEDQQDYARLAFDNTENNNYWHIAAQAETGSADSRMNFFFRNGSVGRDIMSVRGNGNVGINTISPTARLTINQASQTVGTGLRFVDGTANQDWDITHGFGLRFHYGGALRAVISATNGAYIQGSDVRLKKNIAQLEPVLDKVAKLRPTSYQYRSDDTQSRTLGFVAQEVQQVFPELVEYLPSDDLYGINYSGFGVVAIQAIQELQVLLADQGKTIEALSGELQMVRRQTIDVGDSDQSALVLEQKEYIKLLEDKIQAQEERLNRLEAMLQKEK